MRPNSLGRTFSIMQQELNSTIDHLFRTEYVKLVSYLTTKFGAANIDIIEDAVQESLLKAMRLWSFKEIPTEPGKWLYRVSYNRIIDVLRRKSKTVMFNPEIMNDYIEGEVDFEDGLKDNQLKMIFACCHPSMNETEQIILSLKLLCGFSTKEISGALLKETETVKKAISRAKKKFKDEVGELSIPSGSQLDERIEGVLKVIYLLFNSGYTAHSGENLLKKDVCEDALRLGGILYNHPACNTSELKALISLMCYQLSRFDARVNANGKMVIFEHQDRTLWDQELIALGSNFLLESGRGATYCDYQFEAAIAREYAVSKSYDEMNWMNVLRVYNVMCSQTDNIFHQLNRLVIIEKVEGVAPAYKGLLKLDESKLSNSYLYYSIRSNFEKVLGISDFEQHLKKAISLTDNQQEKDFLSGLF